MRGGSTDEQSPSPMYPISGIKGGKKGGSGLMRSWLVLNSSGQAEPMDTEKYKIMQQTGLSARDLRILDPLLSYPSTILGREKAIVINLEHIKAIIKAQEVLLLNSKDPSVSPFIDELQRRIMSQQHQEDVKPSLENQDGSKKVLPFEFIALEACLECASRSLEHEGLRLELETYAALEKLTSKISNLNLEKVRHIKTRLVALTGRVQKVRDELEHLLDDDQDMAEMYLTQKLESDDTVPEGDNDHKLPPEFACEEANRESRGTQASPTRSATSNKFDVKELEMLLGVYFAQMDGALKKLTTLREDVDDTEDYIKIMQDVTQNRVLQMGVMLTAAAVVMNAFIVVASIFGMNIGIELFDDEKAGPAKFLWTVIGGTLGCLVLYFGFIGWCKYKRLFQ